MGARLGDDRNPVARLYAFGDQAVGVGYSVPPELVEGVGAGEAAARIVEIESSHATGRIIQRFAKSAKIGESAREGVRGRSRQKRFMRLPSVISFTVSHVWLDPFIFGRSSQNFTICNAASVLDRKASSYSGLSVAQTWRVTHEPKRKPPGPLYPEALERLALLYVGRYATTRAKLRAYLKRKLTERGWSGACAPDTEALIARFSELGYVDDQAFAAARASSLQRRGYGERRIGQALYAAGIERDDAAGVLEEARDGAWEAALRYAQRKRIGPYGEREADREVREKALAAMIRAGHSFETTRKLLSIAPGEVPERDDF